MDVNKCWLSGLAVTQPMLTKADGRPPFASFYLQVHERFKDKTGKGCVHTNTFKVEGVGRAAELIMERIQEGTRCLIDGYLRQEDREGHPSEVRIRAFTVAKDESADGVRYNQGLKKALTILKKSRDLSAAVRTLEGLLAAK